MPVSVKKKELWRAIRSQCLECVCQSSREIELCTAPKCSLYPYRFGRSPKASDTIYLGLQTYEMGDARNRQTVIISTNGKEMTIAS